MVCSPPKSMAASWLTAAASVMITMDGESRLIIEDSLVSNNRAQSLLYMGDVATPTLQSRIALLNSTFEHNVASYCINGVSLDAVVVSSSFVENDLTMLYATNSNVYLENTNVIQMSSNKSSVTVSIHDDGLSTAPYYSLLIFRCNFVEYATAVLRSVSACMLALLLTQVSNKVTTWWRCACVSICEKAQCYGARLCVLRQPGEQWRCSHD